MTTPDARSGDVMEVRAALRAATAAQHRALEAHPALVRMLCPDVTLADVVRVETALLHYHAAAEVQMLPWRHNLGYIPFPHAAVLRDDLGRLGGAPSDPVTLIQVAAFATLADVAGYLYVAEGSLLGNRLMARHCAAVLPDYHQRGGWYYRDDPARVAACWRPLEALIERLVCQAGRGRDRCIETMIHRASVTFSGIRACLDAGVDGALATAVPQAGAA